MAEILVILLSPTLLSTNCYAANYKCLRGEYQQLLVLFELNPKVHNLLTTKTEVTKWE